MAQTGVSKNKSESILDIVISNPDNEKTVLNIYTK